MSSPVISKNDTLYRQQSKYESRIDSHLENKKKEPVAKAIQIKELLEYPSYIDKLFQQTKTTHIYVEPPPRKPIIEKRLFRLDLIRDFVNFRSYWEASLQKLDNLPENISSKEIRTLLQLMLNLSQISREISNKRYQLQKG